MATVEDTCEWWPAVPNCGAGVRTTSCNYTEACVCDDGSPNFSPFKTGWDQWLWQCNDSVTVDGTTTPSGVASNRTLASTNTTTGYILTEPEAQTMETATRMDTKTMGMVFLVALVILLAFICWRKRSKRDNKSGRRRRGRRESFEEAMPRLHPYMMPPPAMLGYAGMPFVGGMPPEGVMGWTHHQWPMVYGAPSGPYSHAITPAPTNPSESRFPPPSYLNGEYLHPGSCEMSSIGSFPHSRCQPPLSAQRRQDDDDDLDLDYSLHDF